MILVKLWRGCMISTPEHYWSCSLVRTYMYSCENPCLVQNSMSLKQAEKHRFLKGVVGGLDLTKHEVTKTTIVKLSKDTTVVIFFSILWNMIKVMKTTIAKFSKETRPKFVGVRHLIDFEPDDFLTRPDVHAGLAILENHGLTFDLQVWTQIYSSTQTPFSRATLPPSSTYPSLLASFPSSRWWLTILPNHTTWR